MIYDESEPDQPLKRLKATLDDNPYEIMSIGPWLYVFEFNVDMNGTQHNGPLRVISKENQEQVFQYECFIGANVCYFLGTTTEQYILRLDAPPQKPKIVRVEKLSLILQRRVLYVFMLKEISHGNMTPTMIQSVLDAFDEDKDE